MASPPGTYQGNAACVDGQISYVINFDVTTRAFVNRGAPAACIVATNTSTRRGVVDFDGAAVDMTGFPGAVDANTLQIPTGTTRITVAQLAARGLNNVDQLGQIGVGCGVENSP